MQTLRQYEIVKEIARQGSVTRASEVLGVAQPTISKFLQKLESDLGLELFDRSVLPIRLTSAGELYLSTGNKILELNQRLNKQLSALKYENRATLKLGISPSRAAYLLPELIERYSQLNQTATVIVHERTTTQLNYELANGELDLIISLLNDGTKGFDRLHMFSETTLLAAPASKTGFDALTLIKTMPLITIGAGQRMWKVFNDLSEEVGASRPKIECQTFESALGLVKHGLGVTLVPSYMVGYSKNEHIDAIFMPLPKKAYELFSSSLERDVCLFYKNAQFLTEAEKQFISVCENIQVRAHKT